MSRLSPVIVAALAATTVLAACGSAGTGGPGRSSPAPTTSGDEGRAQRAAQLLDRYAAKGAGSPSVDLGDQLEQQVGDWEPAVGENNKLALATGHLVAANPLPDAPGRGKVVDGSGRGVSTTVISADDALAAMTGRRSDCGGCTDLRVTGADLTTMDIATSTGTATVPAWEFSLAGTAVRVLRIAVPLSGLVRATPPSTTQPHPGDGHAVDSFTVLADGRTLRLRFVGAPDEPGPCGADYRGEQYPSSQAVVVTVLEVPRPDTGQDIACTAIGMERTVDVVLADRLGDRTVLNLAGGGVVVQGSGRAGRVPVRPGPEPEPTLR
jgi:hypothetical protein